MSAQSMLAAVFTGIGSLQLQERPAPTINSPDEVLIEVEGCGICGTDLHILEVPPGHPATPGVILGHEFLGQVVETGEKVRRIRPGDRVVVAPNLSCGLCQPCRSGLVNHCEDFTTLGIFRDGGLARHCLAPERACFLISRDLPFEDAVWTELLSCVVHSVDSSAPLSGESVLVIGGGPAGALHSQLFLAAGTRVWVSDLKANRLGLLENLGVHRTIHTEKERLEDAAAESGGRGFDIVVDCVGTQLTACVDLVRVGGRILLFGMNSRANPQVPQNVITRKELTIYGSFVGVNTFPRAIDILEKGVIRPSKLISRILPLEQIQEAIEALKRGDDMKIVIRHNGQQDFARPGIC